MTATFLVAFTIPHVFGFSFKNPLRYVCWLGASISNSGSALGAQLNKFHAALRSRKSQYIFRFSYIVFKSNIFNPLVVVGGLISQVHSESMIHSAKTLLDNLWLDGYENMEDDCPNSYSGTKLNWHLLKKKCGNSPLSGSVVGPSTSYFGRILTNAVLRSVMTLSFRNIYLSRHVMSLLKAISR